LREGALKPAAALLEDGLEKVAWHVSQGHAVVLLTGTLEPLAMWTASAMEADLATRGMNVPVRVCTTRLEENEGRWTGRIIGEVMFGQAKVRAAKRMAEEMQLNLATCYAYGDSANDRYLLEAVGHATAVNPSRELEQIARERRWPVLQWKAEKNFAQRTQSTQRKEGNTGDFEAEALRVTREANARSLG
jgi:phosphoserine phosphatase